MGDAPGTRLYLGNLPRHATKQDVHDHFNQHGTGQVLDIKLMNGFGFVEYKDSADPRDIVPGEPHPTLHGTELMGERLNVQYARGGHKTREFDGPSHRAPPRPRRTVHRMTINGLPEGTSWQDLKDFARSPGLDVVYSEVSRDREDPSTARGFVEYETAEDLTSAVEKLDNSDFKGAPVQCISDTQSELPRGPPPGPPRDRFRSRSPPYRRGYGGPPPDDYYYDRRAAPPRGYSPRRDDYRRRSPPREYYDRRGPPEPYPPRSPPPPRARGPAPPAEDYPPSAPRGRYPPEDPYGAPPPPRSRYPDDPYANGHGSHGGHSGPHGGHGREPYGRPPSPGPRRDRGGYDGYDRRGYW